MMEAKLFILLTRLFLAFSAAIAGDIKPSLDQHGLVFCFVPNDTFPEYFANCSYRNLTEIPGTMTSNVTNNITYLSLVGNSIKQLSPRAWKEYKSLRYLLLARNEIEALEDEDFKYLSQLEVLDLSLNRIRYTSIGEHVFRPLRNLQYLDLKQNLCTSTIWQNETYPIGLSQLPNLKYLMIDGLNNDILPDMMTLSELYLSGDYGRCNITNITAEYFTGVQNVQHLFVSNCSILQVANGTFGDMAQLSSLDVARNYNLGMTSVPNITYGLIEHRKIKRLNLNSLYEYVDNDMCSYIGDDDMRYLANTTIEMLLLERNYLVRISESAVKYFPKSLRFLSISDNMFIYGSYVHDMLTNHTLHNLIYYDTSKMYKSHIHLSKHGNSAYSECAPNEFPEEKSNSNRYCPEKLHNRTNLCNMLTRVIVIDDFEDMCHKMKNNNISADKLSPHCTINKEQNELSDQNNKSSSESKLEYLDVSDNLPGTILIALDLFNNTPNLTFLNVSNNYLGYPLLDEKKSTAVFDSMHNLRTLDLTNNRITKLLPDIFINFTQLEYLYLSNNRLKCIPFKISHLKELRYLDLSFNRLQDVCPKARNALDKLPNVKINLRCNNLMCTCMNIEFVKWLEKNEKKFNIKAWSDTNCSFENSTSIPVRDLNYKQFYFECSPPAYSNIILVTSLLILAFIIIVSCGLVYRFKWNLRYLYYMAKFRLVGGYQPIDDREYEKDVFVSYANEDRIFVRDQIVKELETNGDISLLVHDRDFRAGELVADNIMRAITSTRRTLAVLTAAYIRSKWCMYELNMARMEAADTGRNVLCVILKEDIPVKYLPIEIIDIIKKKTYMEFPTKEEHMELFWNRLRATLHHDN